MTQDISSRFAKDIPKMDEKPGINGTPPTGQTSETTFDDMAEARGATTPRMSDLKYALWVWKGKIKHLVGWHTFVPLEEWDLEAGSYQYIGLTCWLCEERT